MRPRHAPYPRSASHITTALERATVEKADGVLSCFQLVESTGREDHQGSGFVFGRSGFEDETPLVTTPIKSVGPDLIITSSGRRYVISDYIGDAKEDLEALKASLQIAKSRARREKLSD